ncbi:hypothetical protein [Alloscardovia omnicolens]|uniref:hypothetical protein n=1 Tax=Alloscardovia omnicolens TaxID=419015 RepID=UPI003A6AC8D9
MQEAILIEKKIVEQKPTKPKVSTATTVVSAHDRALEILLGLDGNETIESEVLLERAKKLRASLDAQMEETGESL